MSLGTQPLNEQEALVVRLRDEEKLACRDIAARLGVTPSRVHQVLSVAKAKLKDVAEHGEDALSLLPARARRVVTDCGIPSRALVRSAIILGRMTWCKGLGSIFWDGVMLPKVSRKMWAAIIRTPSASASPAHWSEPPTSTAPTPSIGSITPIR